MRVYPGRPSLHTALSLATSRVRGKRERGLYQAGDRCEPMALAVLIREGHPVRGARYIKLAGSEQKGERFFCSAFHGGEATKKKAVVVVWRERIVVGGRGPHAP
jgi:hypothetical protein